MAQTSSRFSSSHNPWFAEKGKDMAFREASEQVTTPRDKVHYVDAAGEAALQHNPTEGVRFTRITMPGPVQQVEVPANWKKLDGPRVRFPDGYSSCFSNPSSPDVGIGFNSSGDPEKRGTGNLTSLLSESPAQTIYSSSWEQQSGHDPDGAREAKAKGIALNLRQVLGSSMLGSNQLTDGAAAAAAHLDRLETKIVNGKPVLSAEGYYMEPDTKLPSSYFSIDIIPFKTPDGIEVHTISLVAQTQAALNANKPMYAHVLNSVKWNDAIR
jgi:hypothetical protein